MTATHPGNEALRALFNLQNDLQDLESRNEDTSAVRTQINTTIQALVATSSFTLSNENEKDVTVVENLKFRHGWHGYFLIHDKTSKTLRKAMALELARKRIKCK